MRKRKRPPVVLGIDASLTGTGLCVIPAEWLPSSFVGPNALHRKTIGYTIASATSEECVIRLDLITRAVVDFAQRHHVTHAFIEDYAFGQPNRAQRIGEVGGTIRLELYRVGLIAQPVSSTSWRKLLIGYAGTPRGFPRGWLKKETFRIVRAAGFDDWGDDEIDALGVANAGRAALDLSALTLAPSRC